MNNPVDSDHTTVALMALSWTLQDQALADRLLALTGLTPDALRAGLTESLVQAAVLDFLASHEANLIAAADGIGVPPSRIVAARDALAGQTPQERARFQI